MRDVTNSSLQEKLVWAVHVPEKAKHLYGLAEKSMKRSIHCRYKHHFSNPVYVWKLTMSLAMSLTWQLTKSTMSFDVFRETAGFLPLPLLSPGFFLFRLFFNSMVWGISGCQPLRIPNKNQAPRPIREQGKGFVSYPLPPFFNRFFFGFLLISG